MEASFDLESIFCPSSTWMMISIEENRELHIKKSLCMHNFWGTLEVAQVSFIWLIQVWRMKKVKGKKPSLSCWAFHTTLLWWSWLLCFSEGYSKRAFFLALVTSKYMYFNKPKSKAPSSLKLIKVTNFKTRVFMALKKENLQSNGVNSKFVLWANASK